MILQAERSSFQSRLICHNLTNGSLDRPLQQSRFAYCFESCNLSFVSIRRFAFFIQQWYGFKISIAKKKPKYITVSTIVCCPNVATPYTAISTKMTIFVFRFFSVIRDKSLLSATISWLCLLWFMPLFGGAPHFGQSNARLEISASHSWQWIRLTIHPASIGIYRLCFRGGPFRSPSFTWVGTNTAHCEPSWISDLGTRVLCITPCDHK